MVRKLAATLVRWVAVVTVVVLSLGSSVIAESYRADARDAWTREAGDKFRNKGLGVLVVGYGLAVVVGFGLAGAAARIEEQ